MHKLYYGYFLLLFIFSLLCTFQTVFSIDENTVFVDEKLSTNNNTSNVPENSLMQKEQDAILGEDLANGLQINGINDLFEASTRDLLDFDNSDLVNELAEDELLELQDLAINRFSTNELIATDRINRLTENLPELQSDFEEAKSRQEVREDATQRFNQMKTGAELAAEISQPTGCISTKYDMALHIIKGHLRLGPVINNLNNADDSLAIELIVDRQPGGNDPIVLIDSISPVIKGRILVDPFDSDPKIFRYNLDQVFTTCLTKSVADKIEKIDSGRNQPFVIGTAGATLLAGGKIFQECTGGDFSKLQIIGDGSELKKKGSYGVKDLTLKILVDVSPVEITANDPITITDDHRVIAAKIILDEGKNDQKIIDFKLNDIITECNTVDFISSPIGIDDEDDELVHPLVGFTNRK